MLTNIDVSVQNTTSLEIGQTRLAAGCTLEAIRESSIGICDEKTYKDKLKKEVK